MDLIIYTLIILSIGFYKMVRSKNEPEIVTLASSDTFTGSTVQVDIPIGNNLRLYKEPDAYTLILQQFGLKR